MAEPAMAEAVLLRTDDGVRLHAEYRVAAAAADLSLGCVVAHGFTMTSRNPHLQRIAAALAGNGSGVLALDLRGHGRSGGLSTAGADEIRDIAAAVAWLRAAGYAQVVTLGWSMGGTSVLRHAGLGGDTDAVVSVSAPGSWLERGTRSMRLVQWMFESRTGRTATRVLRRTRVSAAGWQSLPEPPADVIGSIDAPVLVVHGDTDRYFPLHHVEALAAAAPSARVWIEAGMGHAEIATTDELLERIIEWVSTVCGRASGPATAVCDHDTRD